MTNKVDLILSYEIKTMWLCIILLLFHYSNAIYLPIQDDFANESIIEDFDPGPIKIKLASPSKSTLALTSGKLLFNLSAKIQST